MTGKAFTVTAPSITKSIYICKIMLQVSADTQKQMKTCRKELHFTEVPKLLTPYITFFFLVKDVDIDYIY